MRRGPDANGKQDREKRESGLEARQGEGQGDQQTDGRADGAGPDRREAGAKGKGEAVGECPDEASHPCIPVLGFVMRAGPVAGPFAGEEGGSSRGITI